jgi:hypothetical protein
LIALTYWFLKIVELVDSIVATESTRKSYDHFLEL